MLSSGVGFAAIGWFDAEAAAHPAWHGALIAGISLVDALWLALYAPSAALAVCAVVSFGATPALQRLVAGT